MAAVLSLPVSPTSLHLRSCSSHPASMRQFRGSQPACCLQPSPSRALVNTRLQVRLCASGSVWSLECNKAFQNLPTNCQPLSDTIFRYHMKPQHMLDKKGSQHICKWQTDKGTKCANLLNLSTTTQIVSHPPDIGNLTIKSMELYVHSFRVGKGFNGPKSRALGVTFSNNLSTSHFTACHHTDWDKVLHILVTHG